MCVEYRHEKYLEWIFLALDRVGNVSSLELVCVVIVWYCVRVCVCVFVCLCVWCSCSTMVVLVLVITTSTTSSPGQDPSCSSEIGLLPSNETSDEEKL